MAERDKSQGFGFVYVDVKKLLEEARARVTEATTTESATPSEKSDAPTEASEKSAANVPTPISVQWPTPGAKVLNFNRDTDVVPAPTADAVPSVATQNPSVALKQIRQSLDRLQALHHKLHAVLAELSQATERDRKK